MIIFNFHINKLFLPNNGTSGCGWHTPTTIGCCSRNNRRTEDANRGYTNREEMDKVTYGWD
jgi:hypothetical protein